MGLEVFAKAHHGACCGDWIRTSNSPIMIRLHYQFMLHHNDKSTAWFYHYIRRFIWCSQCPCLLCAGYASGVNQVDRFVVVAGADLRLRCETARVYVLDSPHFYSASACAFTTTERALLSLQHDGK